VRAALLPIGRLGGVRRATPWPVVEATMRQRLGQELALGVLRLDADQGTISVSERVPAGRQRRAARRARAGAGTGPASVDPGRAKPPGLAAGALEQDEVEEARYAAAERNGLVADAGRRTRP
jgi:hypothetical protein